MKLKKLLKKIKYPGCPITIGFPGGDTIFSGRYGQLLHFTIANYLDYKVFSAHADERVDTEKFTYLIVIRPKSIKK